MQSQKANRIRFRFLWNVGSIAQIIRIAKLTSLAFLFLILNIGQPHAVEGELAGEISKEEELRIKEFLKRSVTVGTEKGYASGIKKWKEYLQTLPSEFHPGDYLEALDNDERKSKRVVLYMAHLYLNVGWRGEQVRKAVTCLTYHFEIAGLSSTFLRLAIVSRGKSAAGRNTEEARSREEEKAAHSILPVCMDVILSVREKYWENQNWDNRGKDSKAIWLAVALAFDSGARIGNLTLKDGKDREDHCIRAKHVSYLVTNPTDGKEYRIQGGEEISQYLKRNDVNNSLVIEANMIYMTSKTSKSGSANLQEPKTLGRNSHEESQLLDDLLDWIKHNNVVADEELLTRHGDNGSRRVVKRKDVRQAIKEAVGAFGLPEDRFSTRSLRSGFGTHAQANGLEEREIHARGGWAANSKVPEKHYIRRMHNRGAFAIPASASGRQMHGLGEIQRMLPVQASTAVGATGIGRVG